MVNKRLILIMLLVVLLLCSPVFASNTFTVTEKRIDGNKFIIGYTDFRTDPGHFFRMQEYPVSVEDYDKIKLDDKVKVSYNKFEKQFDVKIIKEDNDSWW